MNLKLRTFGAFKNLGSITLKGLLSAALVLVVSGAWGQVTILSENMGSPTGTTSIASHTFQNPSLTFSGTADVRTTTASTGYTGASGSGNVFFTNTIGRTFEISGISTLGYTSITLEFGQYKSATAANNELVVEVSSDGSNYDPLSYTRSTGTGTTNWVLVSPTGTIPSTGNLRIRFRQTSGTAQFRLDDVVLKGTLAATPSITINNNNNPISSGNVNQGAVNHILSQTQAEVSTANATLNSLSFPTTGTYDPADVANFKLRYSTDVTLDAGDATLATVTVIPTTSNTVSFTGLNQVINNGSTGYFFITTDISVSATAGNTIGAGQPTYTFASGTPTNNSTAGILQTIQAVTPLISLSSPNPAVAAANMNQFSTNNLLYRFDLATTVANTNLTAFNITTNGTYAANAVSNLKAWYSTDATFDAGSDVLLATLASPATAGTQSFSGFSQLLTSGTTGYIFVTVDVSCDAIIGATIGVDAIATTDLTTTATKSGSANAGGTQTFTAASVNQVTGASATAASQSAQISWTAPAGCYDEVMVVVQPTFSSALQPTGDGSAYTADLNFSGSGSSYDVNGGKVVYKGTGTSINVTGLTNGISYWAMLYARKGTSWSSNVNTNFYVDSFIEVNFDDAAKWTQGTAPFTSYGNHSYADGQVTVQGTRVIRNTTATQDGFVGAFGTYAWRLENASGSKIVFTIASGGVRSFKVDIRRWDGSPSPDVSINYSTDGGNNWNNLTNIDNDELDGSSNWKTFSFIRDINSPLRNIMIEIVSNSAGERIMVDNFEYSERPFTVTTWDGSTWSDVYPDFTKNAVINSNLTLNQPIEANQITINTGFTLNSSTYKIETNGDLINNGALVIESADEALHGVLNVKGSISGNPVSIQRKVEGSTNGWRFLASPVSSTLNDLGTSVLVTGQANVIRLNTNNPNAWVAQGGTTGDAMAFGKGYAAYFGPSGVNGSNVATTITLTGTVNNTGVTVAGLSDGSASNDFGWSLVGNPFPASIDFDSDHTFINMTNLEPAYYIWDADAGNYYTWHRTSGSSPSNTLNGIVPMGHGFVVKANASNPVLTINRTALSTEEGQVRQGPSGPSITGSSNNTARTSALTDRLYIKVRHTGDNRKDETMIAAAPTATVNFESAFDALKATSMSTTAYSISTRSADGKQLAINTLPAFDANHSVPVRISGNQPGPMSLSVDLSAVNSTVPIMLEDLHLNRSHDLRTGAYQFAHIPAQSDRFVIHFAPLATSVKANSIDQVQVYTFEGKLYIRGMEQAEELRIVDMTGRVVYQNSAVVLTAEGVQPQLAAGTYLVQLVGKQGVKTAKVQF